MRASEVGGGGGAAPRRRRAPRDTEATPAAGLPWGLAVERLRGVGPARSAALERRGIRTLIDLLFTLPLGYEQLPRLGRLEDVEPGEALSFTGRIRSQRSGRLRRRGGSVLDVNVVPEDTPDAAPVRVRFFNQRWLASSMIRDARLLVAGQRDPGGARTVVARHHFVLEADEDPGPRLAALLPRRTAIEGIAAGTLGRLVGAALQEITDRPDPLASAVIQELALPPAAEAFGEVHAPSGPGALERAGARLLFDRFLALFLSLGGAELGPERAPALPGARDEIETLAAALPFELTPGQRSALGEILRDLESARPMRRLLQGDVGSGKTAVALAAALAVVRAGHQVLFLAPTEPLAQQHLGVAAAIVEDTVSLGFLSAGLEAPRRRQVQEDLRSGRIDLLVATHAALGPKVRFRSLGLAIIDEQHRFGVRQRLAARAKGSVPHMLAMSATPIPRTLCLALHGDLEHTVIGDRPGGGAPVRTVAGRREDAFADLRAAIEAGHRGFVVFPSIDGEDMPALLRHGPPLLAPGAPLHGLEAGLLHGRQSLEERARALSAFREGSVPLLLCTVIVEVGLDVEEATVMVVAGADRFGLATLHQLRGRVGRGRWPGVCHLLPSRGARAAALARLAVLEREHDGFRIAEADLALRGPGELVGLRQSGCGGDLLLEAERDATLFEAARNLARESAAGTGPAVADPSYYASLAGSMRRLPSRPADAV